METGRVKGAADSPYIYRPTVTIPTAAGMRAPLSAVSALPHPRRDRRLTW